MSIYEHICMYMLSVIYIHQWSSPSGSKVTSTWNFRFSTIFVDTFRPRRIVSNIGQNTPKLHISSCSVVIWTCIVVRTPLVVVRGFWGCLGVQMSVLELNITFFHLGRPSFGQGPRCGWHMWHTPKYPKIAHIAVYSNWMVMDRGCNPPGGIWGRLEVFRSTNESFCV